VTFIMHLTGHIIYSHWKGHLVLEKYIHGSPSAYLRCLRRHLLGTKSHSLLSLHSLTPCCIALTGMYSIFLHPMLHKYNLKSANTVENLAAHSLPCFSYRYFYFDKICAVFSTMHQLQQ
jgi:hypothetical protein